MARVIVDGKISTPSKTGSFFILNEFVELNNGNHFNRKWVCWQPIAINWTEGTYLKVEGEFGESVQRDDTGTPRTFLDKNGHQVTSRDLTLNNVVILEERISNPAPANVDMDDVRKYGSPMMQVMDENPF